MTQDGDDEMEWREMAYPSPRTTEELLQAASFCWLLLPTMSSPNPETILNPSEPQTLNPTLELLTESLRQGPAPILVRLEDLAEISEEEDLFLVMSDTSTKRAVQFLSWGQKIEDSCNMFSRKPLTLNPKPFSSQKLHKGTRKSVTR